MKRLACAWLLAAAALLSPLAGGQSAVEARFDVGRSGPAQVPAAPAKSLPNVAVHAPARLDPSQAAQVLIVLHGMGGSGQDMLGPFVEYAERYGWVVVAPTFQYRDWRDPEQVRLDGRDYLPALKQLIDGLPGRLGRPVAPQVVLFGFSRGGQVAQRFALFYPQYVRGVVSVAAGTYTLPMATVGTEQGEQALPFPYGVGDLERYTGRGFNAQAVRDVSFLISVGATDNRAADVPRQWDRYIGATRVERAQSFAQALSELGARVELRVVANMDHEVTAALRAYACEYLRSVLGAQ